MAEADLAIYIATAAALAICTAIQFGERAIRYRRIKEAKSAGTMGMEYQTSDETEQDRKRSTPI
ncbi:MAG: hypothetical protein WAM14_06085 [Candidatus Nitrosopolaris sp.]